MVQKEQNMIFFVKTNKQCLCTVVSHTPCFYRHCFGPLVQLCLQHINQWRIRFSLYSRDRSKSMTWVLKRLLMPLKSPIALPSEYTSDIFWNGTKFLWHWAVCKPHKRPWKILTDVVMCIWRFRSSYTMSIFSCPSCTNR